MSKARTFEDREAVRESVPLLVGLTSPSGGGKTYSALRLASGMQKVVGGDIYVIDTESRRALHYADSFKFRHIDFKPPFSPDDYLAAIEYAKKKGAGVIVVDSASHEHEGPGGVLEWHESELDRMAGDDWKKRDRAKFSAWIKPKQARTRLINSILQMGVNGIFCFRAKEKLEIKRGKDPVDLGFMPITGDEFAYEMTMRALLYPNSDGVPTWDPDKRGEQIAVKLPSQFRDYFSKHRGPLDEDAGRFMAEWARGGEAPQQRKSVPEPETDHRTDMLEAIKGTLRDAGLHEKRDAMRAALRDAFGTDRWSDIEKMDVDALGESLDALRERVA